MRVLSIDFDFFQDVTEEQLKLYPDGVDLDTYISSVVWSGHYSTHGKQIREIGIRRAELDKLIQLLQKQKTYIPVMVANSHVHIYKFIMEQCKRCRKLDITHVDMHHDMFNNSPKLDCGNWLRHIRQDFQLQGKPVHIKWITNPLSLHVYGLDKTIQEHPEYQGLIEYSLDSVVKQEYDLIFLCRSDNWTPPHLDKYFSELCNVIAEHFTWAVAEQGINKPRTIQEIALRQFKNKLEYREKSS